MDELKECPFCGTKAASSVFRVDVHNWYEESVLCEDCRCRINHPKAIAIWNRRPAEDALTAEVERLKAENDELRYIVEQFKQWYNENGCPKKHNPDFPCSAEHEYKDDPETEGDFDELDCWKEEHEHGCWVEYYCWKYQQMIGKDTDVPAKESEGEDE